MKSSTKKRKSVSSDNVKSEFHLEQEANVDTNSELYVSTEEIGVMIKMYEQLCNGEIVIESVEDSPAVSSVKKKIDLLKENMCQKSKTAKLWIAYMEYIDVVKMFIRAERTGNWVQHLDATERMLNLFAATGHVHYAKSARLYLQLMNRLNEDYPWLHQQFT